MTNPLVTMKSSARAMSSSVPTWREKFIAVRRLALSAALERDGITTETELVTDMLYGAMWYRLLTGHAPLDAHLASQLAAAARAIASTTT